MPDSLSRVAARVSPGGADGVLERRKVFAFETVDDLLRLPWIGRVLLLHAHEAQLDRRRTLAQHGKRVAPGLQAMLFPQAVGRLVGAAAGLVVHHEHGIARAVFAQEVDLALEVKEVARCAGAGARHADIRIVGALALRADRDAERHLGAHALARRSPAIKSEILTAGDLTFDRGRCTVKSRSGEIRLSGKETLLIDIFLSNPGQVVSRETIQARVWGSDSQSTYNSIEVYLTLLRRKLRSIGSEAQICAERGLGYYLAE